MQTNIITMTLKEGRLNHLLDSDLTSIQTKAVELHVSYFDSKTSFSMVTKHEARTYSFPFRFSAAAAVSSALAKSTLAT